jgi:hypothetical protein
MDVKIFHIHASYILRSLRVAEACPVINVNVNVNVINVNVINDFI